jgi:nicotinamidase-related amidase
MADPVLLIVDVQQDYFPGGRMPLPDMPAAAVQIARLLAHFRALRKPVVHIRHLATAPDAGFFEADTPGAEFHPSVTPQTEEPCILKHFPNAFRDTDLLTTLERLSARRLVICGAMSNMCIDAVTRAAADAGFACTVIADGCAARAVNFNGETVSAAQVHAAFLANLAAAYAQVISTDQFLDGVADASESPR